jgi:hypothetical protein
MEPDTNPPNTTSSWKSQRDHQWESVKYEVYQVYMKHGNTLRKTIEVVGPKLGFTARRVNIAQPNLRYSGLMSFEDRVHGRIN